MPSHAAVSPGLLESVVSIAHAAGDLILSWRAEEISPEMKSDGSPVTSADLAANRLIGERLAELTPRIPVIAEESPIPSWETRRHWREFWLVDPLDGTKEFVRGSGEFTVNIALVRDGYPVLGVVHAPVLGRTWVSDGARAELREGDLRVPIRTRAACATLAVATSRDHLSVRDRELLDRLGVAERHPAGSSIKFCLTAEGRVDLYPRLAPTMEWDTAAAQAVVEGAGGAVVDPAGERLRYNGPALRNEGFVTVGDRRLVRKVVDAL